MKQYVWIIAGGPMQVPMIGKVHHRGYGVILTDGNEQCVAKEYLYDDDIFWCLDTYDEEVNIKLAGELRQSFNIIGVMAPSADVGPTVSAIAETLGLPGVYRDVAQRVRNKIMMRILLGFPYPRYMPGQSYTHNTIRTWERENASPYPCVVKAVDNCASRGMSIVTSPGQMESAVKKAFAANKRASGVLIEQMLSGDEYSTDWIIENGHAIYINGCYRPFRKWNKYTGERLYGVEAGIVNPIIYPPKTIHEETNGILIDTRDITPIEPLEGMTSIATIAARRLGVTEGWFKIDFINDKVFGWCVLECTTRCSGGWDSSHVAPLVGNNMYDILLDYSIGLPLDKSRVGCHNGLYAVTYAPLYPEGKIDGWSGLDDAMTFASYIFPRSTEYIPKLIDSATRSMFIIAVGDSPCAAWTKAARAAKLITPRYVNV